MGLVPQCGTNRVSHGAERYPFSYGSVVSAILKESGKIASCGTLVGKSMEHIAAVVVKLMKLFGGFRFDPEFCRLFGVDALVEFSSEPDPPEGYITQSLEKKIDKTIALSAKGFIQS